VSKLHLEDEGLTLLRDRLREANVENRKFSRQYESLVGLLQQALSRLEQEFEPQISQVRAVGDWAESGVDLRDAACEDILLDIVLRSDERSFDLYYQLADRVFSDLQITDFPLQFRITTASEWEYAESGSDREKENSPGIRLLSRG
jgi:hypothetical protein